MKKFSLAIAVMAAALLVAAADAQAQFSNQPFSFQGRGLGVSGFGFGGSGSSVGMSSAYRQLILERELFRRPTDNGTFTRAPDGSLVNVVQHDRLAFARTEPAPFLVRQGGVAAGAAGFGFSIGVGGASIGVSYGDSSFYSMDGIPAVLGARPGAVPIDSWIQQLDSMPDSVS